ncbi:UNVERIFIED_CONTAM: hypothetical protein H355_008054 [Colinus virginianus]|nr:hypothetical protein H355_008054 [Colinus virginianus]
MADFSNKLGQNLLTTEERVVAVSAVVLLLLLIVDVYHSSEEELKVEDELLEACIKQLENKVMYLTGQTVLPSNGTSPLKLRPILLEEEKNLHQQDPWILVESKNEKKAKQIEIQLEDLGTSDPLEIRPVITQKTEKI